MRDFDKWGWKRNGCSWPSGHPYEETFHFCGEPQVDGRPYCADHLKKAYIRVGKKAKLPKSLRLDGRF